MVQGMRQINVSLTVMILNFCNQFKILYFIDLFEKVLSRVKGLVRYRGLNNNFGWGISISFWKLYGRGATTFIIIL